MKGIFPYDKQEVIIKIPKNDLLNELKKNVQLTGYIPFVKDKKSTKFYGTTMSSTWKISLKTNYRNSFKPVVYLKLLEEGEKKTRMIMEFKLHIAIRIIMVIALLIASTIMINNLLEGKNLEEYYWPAGFIGILLLFSNFGFYMSLDHSTQALDRILRKIITTANSKS